MLKGANMHRLAILQDIEPTFLIETNENIFKDAAPSEVWQCTCDFFCDFEVAYVCRFKI
jgi:hypothetical protein